MKRITLLLLGLFWGALIFNTGLDRGFIFAFLVASPLVLGAFTTGSRSTAAKYFRWLCFVLLIAQSAYWFYGIFTIPFGLFIGFGAIVLMLPDGEPAKRLHWSVELIVVGVFIWWGWFHNPLPSDKEMIDHFNAHRAEFNQLVQGYRDFRQLNAYYEKSSPEVMDLAIKLRVCCLRNLGDEWVPDPYSERAARFREGLNTRSADPQNRPRLATPEDWQREMPELFEAVPPITDWTYLTQQIGYVVVRLGTFNNPDSGYTLRLGLNRGRIYKAYWHFPQVPQIQDQRLAEPTQTRDGKPTIKLRERIFDSLDTFPLHWAQSECLLRRIDPQWFLAMCQ